MKKYNLFTFYSFLYLPFMFLNFVFCLNSEAQKNPYSLPSKKTIDSGPTEILPNKGNTDPLLKRTSTQKTKKIYSQNHELVDFIGVIQYAKGRMSWSGSDRNDSIAFKTLFRWNESLLVEKNSYLKFISHSGCIGVIYGKSQLQTPLPYSDNFWNVIGGSSRWICGEFQEENIHLNGHPIQLKNGEIMYHRELLTVVRGSVFSESGELLHRRTYQWNKNQWEEKYSTRDTYQIWKLLQELKAPKESVEIPKPKN